MVNLYDDPANDELIQELKQELEELRIVYMVPERPGI